MPKTARELAWETLSRWVLITDPPHIPERDDQAWSAAVPRDRAQAFDMLSGIIRWRGLLDAVTGAFLKQPPASLDAGVRAVLWIGAYQLLIQESAKPYAAVDEAVELCKIRATPKASGLVNAVLRNILRAEPKTAPRAPGAANRFPRDAATDIIFNRPLLPSPEASYQAYLAAATSHPPEFVGMLLAQFGPEKALEILIADNHRPSVYLRSEDGGYNPTGPSGLLPLASTTPGHPTARYFVASEGWNPVIADLVKRGFLCPQDPTAGLVASKLAELVTPNAVICDLCAGLGTKTIQLARRLPLAKVVASDIDRQKLARLQNRTQETTVNNVTVAAPDQLSALGPYDAILIDAPCSNTGVLSRRVQARWRWPRMDAAAMTKLQFSLLEQATNLLKPGGHLAYATCSIDAAENGKMLQKYITESNGKATLLAELATVPTADHDGGYYFIVRNKAD